MNSANNTMSQGSGREVKDYTAFNEGDIEPSLNKKIHTLIDSDNTYIVYLDDELAIEWSYNKSYGQTPKGFSDVANGIGHLEALSDVMLGSRLTLPFRRLLAEAMARILGDKDEVKARESLNTAQAFLLDRGLEQARSWYLWTAFIATFTALLAAWLIWSWKQYAIEAIGQDGLQVSMGAMFGSIGSLIFIIERFRQIELNAAAGPAIHRLESAARVVTGIVGSLLVALAVKSNIVLGVANSPDHKFAFLLVLCIVGGASERLVPSLIKRVEDSVVVSDEHKHKAQRGGPD